LLEWGFSKEAKKGKILGYLDNILIEEVHMMAEPTDSRMEGLYNQFQGASSFSDKLELFEKMGELHKSTLEKVQRTVNNQPLTVEEMKAIQRDLGWYEKASQELTQTVAASRTKIVEMMKNRNLS